MSDTLQSRARLFHLFGRHKGHRFLPLATQALITLTAIFVSNVGVVYGDPPTTHEEWKSLFDGHSLDGWFVKCRPEDADKRNYWRVENGTITARGESKNTHHYIWLLTDQEFGDFELRMKVQTYHDSPGNSGVQVRSRYDDQASWLDGPQVDINPAGPWRCGFIYDETREVKAWLWPDVGRPANAKLKHAPSNWKWYHADQQAGWNDLHIICKGTQIKTIVNGVTVADFDGTGKLDDADHQKHQVGLAGRIGLQIHPGKSILIRFKEIAVRPIKQSE